VSGLPLFNGDEELTPRELEIEKLLCTGYARVNVAALLGISSNTVAVHVTSIYRKRCVHSQVELAIAYAERTPGLKRPHPVDHV
jgi:DNA-binding NarL/FixJ family response regulator